MTIEYNLNEVNKLKIKLNTYIRNSILKPYLIHVEFELENIYTRIKTDKFLKQLLIVNGYNIRSFELDMFTAIQKITELQKLFREFEI